MAMKWYDLGNGRMVMRSEPKERGQRSDFPTPYFVSDRLDEPLYSGADGKQYTSKSALRATYKASGNPQGVEYIEVGDDTSVPVARDIQTSDSGIDAALTKAIQRLS